MFPCVVTKGEAGGIGRKFNNAFKRDVEVLNFIIFGILFFHFFIFKAYLLFCVLLTIINKNSLKFNFKKLVWTKDRQRSVRVPL